MDDWRLQGQENFLQNVHLVKKKYKKFRNDWDHDHCEFCGEKFSEHKSDLNKGYATNDNYHWICSNCYNDFKAIFNWKITSNENEKLK